MSDIDFPDAPAMNQEFTVGVTTYKWNGIGWAVKDTTASTYVNVSGDTMTGDLTIAKVNPVFTLNKTAGANFIRGQTAGVNRWYINPGNGTAEGGTNAGSDFSLTRFADDGAQIDNPLTILRSSALATFGGDLRINRASPVIYLDKTAGGEADIIGRTGGLARWQVQLGGSVAESGGNVGSDFFISRFSDAGTYLDNPLQILRSSGLASVRADPTAALGIATKQYADKTDHGGVIFDLVNSLTVQLRPYKGGLININGIFYKLTGVINSAAPAALGLLANTVYLVYVYDSGGGALVLEFSGQAYTNFNGVEVKTGDASRTLVGMVYTDGGGQFAAGARVLSWFNRRPKSALMSGGNQSTTSTANVPMTPALPFCTWGDDPVVSFYVCQGLTSGGYASFDIAFDGGAISAAGAGTYVYGPGTLNAPVALTGWTVLNQYSHSVIGRAGATGGGTATANNQAVSITVMG